LLQTAHAVTYPKAGSGDREDIYSTTKKDSKDIFKQKNVNSGDEVDQANCGTNFQEIQ